MRGRRPEQPVPELAFLQPGEAHDLARVVGAALHERERLQHGVVQVRGHVGPLVGPDAVAAFLHERARQPHRPGPITSKVR